MMVSVIVVVVVVKLMIVYVCMFVYITVNEPCDDTFLDDESVKNTCRLEERGICLMVYLYNICIYIYMCVYFLCFDFTIVEVE